MNDPTAIVPSSRACYLCLPEDEAVTLIEGQGGDAQNLLAHRYLERELEPTEGPAENFQASGFESRVHEALRPILYDGDVRAVDAVAHHRVPVRRPGGCHAARQS